MVSSAHVIGDIGFKRTKGLKWKGKHAMNQRELQVESVMRRIQTRSKVCGCGCPTKLEIVFYVLMNLWLFKQT